MCNALKHHESLADYPGNLALLEGLAHVPGDVLEIGALTGGDSRALGSWANAHGKTMVVIDVFVPGTDVTENTDRHSMADIYDEVLEGANNWHLFAYNTAEVKRRVVYRLPSSDVVLPERQRFCFAFVDGSHAYDDVLADAELVWPHLSARGWTGFDDYGHDLPEVDKAIDLFTEMHREEIDEVRTTGYQRYLRRRPQGS